MQSSFNQIIMNYISKWTIVLFLSPCIVFFSCKKNSTPFLPKETALSKVFENDILQTEYFYSAERKIERINYYNEAGDFLFAFLYSYNSDGNVVLQKQVDIQNKVAYQTTYTWQTKEKISKEETMPLFGTDSAKITTRKKYIYDLNGRISKRVWTDVQTDKDLNWQIFEYFDNGNLKLSESYNNGVMPKLTAKFQYTSSITTAPQSLFEFSAEPLDIFILTYNNKEYQGYFYNNAGLTTTEFTVLRSNVQRDSKEFILSQTQTEKYQKPVKPSKIVNVRYQYIDL